MPNDPNYTTTMNRMSEIAGHGHLLALSADNKLCCSNCLQIFEIDEPILKDCPNPIPSF